MEDSYQTGGNIFGGSPFMGGEEYEGGSIVKSLKGKLTTSADALVEAFLILTLIACIATLLLGYSLTQWHWVVLTVSGVLYGLNEYGAWRDSNVSVQTSYTPGSAPGIYAPR